MMRFERAVLVVNRERWFSSYCRVANRRDTSSAPDMIVEQLESIRMREQMYIQNLIVAQSQYESGAADSTSDSALGNIKLFENMLTKLCEMRLDCLEQLRKCVPPQEGMQSESAVHIGLPDNFRSSSAGEADQI